MQLTMGGSFYSAVFSGALLFATLAGPAGADMQDPLGPTDTTEVTSQGMRSVTGDIYSQGMMAKSGPWEGEIYSQGMMMSTGDIYSQGMEVTIPGGKTNSPPPDQGCVGTAPNCTDNVTNTPTVSNPPVNQAALPIGVIPIASADAIPEPASLALLASALLWSGLVRRQRNRMQRKPTLQ
jgi:hypothetical protein